MAYCLYLLQDSWISGRPRRGPGAEERQQHKVQGWWCCGDGRWAPLDLIGEQWGSHNPYVDYIDEGWAWCRMVLAGPIAYSIALAGVLIKLQSPNLIHAKWFMRTPASAILQAQPEPSFPVSTVAGEATTHSYEQRERRWRSK